MSHITPRVSYGVIICRKHPTAGRMQALLVRRRNSYAYLDFVGGHHRRQNAITNTRLLFAQMTGDEIVDIASLNPLRIWARTLYGPSVNHAQAQEFCNMFQRTFLADGGTRLLNALAKTSPACADLWGPPKGRAERGETPPHASVRETFEETQVPRTEYSIVPGARCRTELINKYSHYEQHFHVAWAHPALNRRTSANGTLPLNLRAPFQINEVSEIRWMGLDDIRRVNGPKNTILFRLVLRAFHIIQNFHRARRTAVRRYAAAVLPPPPPCPVRPPSPPPRSRDALA